MDNPHDNVRGALWGIAIGIPSALLGCFIGFSAFGLLFFAYTGKAEVLVGATSAIAFFVGFTVAFLYFRKKKQGRIRAPIGIIILEVLAICALISGLNLNTKRMYGNTTIIADSVLSGLDAEVPGTYRVSAEVEENSLVCTMRLESGGKAGCVETGTVTLEDMDRNGFKVFPQIEPRDRLLRLDPGRTYLFIIEKVGSGDAAVYNLRDFEVVQI